MKYQAALWLAGISILCGWARNLEAQTMPQAASYVLDSHDDSVIRQLYDTHVLELGNWQYHDGDIPHGEFPGLDTRDWPAATGKVTSTASALWVRRVIEIPPVVGGYASDSMKVSLLVTAYAQDYLTRIVYVNGERVAMGEELTEPIVLTTSAKAGMKFVVAEKFLGGSGEITVQRGRLAFQAPADRPDPMEIHDGLRSAAQLVEAGSREAEHLKKAFQSVDIQALSRGDQATFDRSLKAAREELTATQPGMSRYTLDLIGNSHIDAAWLWPRSETVDVVRRTFGSALQLMNEYPAYKFTQSTAQYFEWMGEKYPRLSESIHSRVKEGRWELVGGMWVEPDLNLIDGESIVRQLLLGKQYFQHEYGVDVAIGWNPDSFGFSWQLPQIYKKSGVNYFVTQKMGWNDTNQLPLKLFWWESPDGSRVLSYFPAGYANEVDSVQMAKQLAKAKEVEPGTTSLMYLYGVGDHGGGPTRLGLDEATRLTQAAGFPRVSFGSATKFFQEAEKDLSPLPSPTWSYQTLDKGTGPLLPDPDGRPTIPIWKDELYAEFHRGVFTTHADQKHHMRVAEASMLDSEKFASLAFVSGNSYPKERLDEAWKLVLFNQFHDLAAGSGIGAIYKDAERDFQAVNDTTENIKRDSFDLIEARIKTNSEIGQPIIVFNSLGWERNEVVEAEARFPQGLPAFVTASDGEGHPIPAEVVGTDENRNSVRVRMRVKGIPSLGYSVIYLSPGRGASENHVRLRGLTMENENVRVEVDGVSGCITSLMDMATGHQLLAPGSCGNELQFFRDEPKQYDAWEISEDFESHRIPIPTRADSVEVSESPGICAAIRVRRHWQSSEFTQVLRLCEGSPRVDIVSDIDWHETHVLLKAAFPVNVSNKSATYEIPYGTIERPTTRDNSVDKAKFEVPALRWADLSDQGAGLSLLNQDKYGYDVHGSLMRLTLLRSPVYPDPLADRGHHHFIYAIYPHAGDWRAALTIRRGYDLNYPLYVHQVARHEGTMPSKWSFAEAKPDNVIVTALKRAEDDQGLIMRLFEWAGHSSSVTIRAPAGATSACEVNLMEKPAGPQVPIIDNSTVTLPLGAYEIKTVRFNYEKHADMPIGIGRGSCN